MKKEIDQIYKCLWRAFKDIGEKQEKKQKKNQTDSFSNVFKL